MTPGTKRQAKPARNHHPRIVDLVIEDLARRGEAGIATYGTALQPMNGRDALVDLYQELLDAAKYARQMIEERRIDERWYRSHIALFSILQDYRRTGAWSVPHDVQEEILLLFEGPTKRSAMAGGWMK